MEQKIKNFVDKISQATLEITNSPKEYSELLNKIINISFYETNSNS